MKINVWLSFHLYKHDDDNDDDTINDYINTIYDDTAHVKVSDDEHDKGRSYFYDGDNNVTDGILLNYLLCQRLDVYISKLPTVHAAPSGNSPAFVNMDIHGQTLDMSVLIPPQL